jgi:hypothetical protein
MNVATAKNLRGESLAECAARLRKDHGLFAEGYALTCWRYFQGSHQNDLAIFYKVVATFISVGVELDEQRRA